MSQLELLVGADAMQKSRRPQEPIVRTAEIETCGMDTYRWVMHRAWGPGKTIVWVLLNPSVADGKKDDPTTQRMMGFAYRWGFGSMVVANMYPLVSSTTDKLHAWRKTFDHKAYEDHGMRPWGFDSGSWSAFVHNCGSISNLIKEDTTLVAAWGAGAPKEDVDYFLQNVRMKIDDEEFGNIGIDPRWWCLGRTADGSPTHPLARGKHRVPDDAALQIWKSRQNMSRNHIEGCT